MANIEPKVCNAILFSDSVIREEGTGKLTIVGCFEHFMVPHFPFKTPPICVTTAVTNLHGKIESMNFALRVEDNKVGFVVTSAAMTLTFTRDLDRTDDIMLPFRLPPFQIPTAGLYNVIVLADNEVIGSRYLPVKPVTAISNPV